MGTEETTFETARAYFSSAVQQSVLVVGDPAIILLVVMFHTLNVSIVPCRSAVVRPN